MARIPSDSDKRLLIIGLDGADYFIFNSFLSKGLMPHLDHIVSRGCYGQLISTIPPATPVAWRSLASGVDPGKHGVFGFTSMDREYGTLETTMLRKDPNAKLWHILGELGWRVGVLNFPYYFPPDQVEPFFVSGFGSPESSDYTYPATLRKDLGKDYRVQYSIRPDLDPIGFLEEVRSITHQRVNATLRLMHTYDLNAIWVTFMTLDWIQHHFWEQHEILEEFHALVDEAIGRLLGESGWDDAAVLIVSDHGFKRVKQEIWLNVFLRNQGYLHLRQGTTAVRSKAFQLALTASRMLRRFGINLREIISEQHISQMINIRPDFVAQIDWSKTLAYSMGYLGDVWLNVGDPEKRHRLRGTLKADLLGLKNPETGKPVIEKVVYREELYAGPHAEEAPDLVAIPSEDESGYAFNCWVLEESNWIGKCRKQADHAPSGIFVHSAEGVCKGCSVSELNIIDVVPTLLYSLNLPIPVEIDGEIAYRAFTEEKTARSTPQYRDYISCSVQQGHLTIAEEAEVIERLRGLGYVE